MIRKISLVLILAILTNYASSQYIGYMKIAERFSLGTIKHISSGGYITIGEDNSHNPQIMRWNDQFDTLWTILITDTNIVFEIPQIIEANDGNFYYMNTSQEHSGCTLIIKISSSGNIIWQKLYYLNEGQFFPKTLSKAAGSDNGFVIGGSQCFAKNFVVKCDQDGNLEWQNQYYFSLAVNGGYCTSIVADSNEYIISGGYLATIDNAYVLLTSKLDTAGNVKAQSAYTYSSKQIVPVKIEKLNSTGGYAILGNYNGGTNKEFIAIYDSILNLQTFNELTVNYSELYLLDITTINNGHNIIATGFIYDSTKFTTAIINLSKNGTIIWKKRSHGVIDQNITNVQFNSATYNDSTIVNCGSSFYDGGVIGIVDTLGNGLCNNDQFDLINYHKSLGIQSGSFYIDSLNLLIDTVNYTNTSCNYTQKEVYCEGMSNIMEDESNLENTFMLYPNPVINTLIIETSLNSNIEISTIEGHIIKSVLSHGNSTTVDLTEFSSGIYFVRLITNNGIMIKKIIKE